MGWIPFKPPRSHYLPDMPWPAAMTMSDAEAQKLREYFIGVVMTPNEARQAEAMRADLPIPSIVPRGPARHHRPASLECKGCGAIVHPNEAACSYCRRMP